MKSIVDNEKLTSLANAIRTKTNTTDSLTIDQMTSAIENISVGGGEDRLKKFIDNRGCKYLFYYYTGTSVNDLISYNDTENATDMVSMFSYCSNLTAIPLLNTSKVTKMYSLFYSCTNLTTIPSLDTSKVTNMESMFGGCKALTTIPQLDTSSVTSIRSMFSNCTNLTTIPQLNTSKVTDMNSLFGNCTNLTTIPQLNTSKVYDMGYMFSNCTNLTTIQLLDLISLISSPSNMFNNCSNLTNLTLKNIKVNLQIGNGTSWGHKLTLDSLINTCKECINVGSSRTLTIGTANMAKIENIYVRFTNTDITSIELNEKGEVEVCESTDEGAMTLAQYMSLKRWSLA